MPAPRFGKMSAAAQSAAKSSRSRVFNPRRTLGERRFQSLVSGASSTQIQSCLLYTSVSAGCVHTDMTTGCDLDDYVREADAIMYEEKTAKKANRT